MARLSMATTARVWPTVCCDLLAHIFLSNPGSGIRVNVETFTVRQCIRHLYLPKDLSRVNKSTFWGQSSSGLLALSRFLQTLCITSPQHPAAISCCPTSSMMHTFASFVKYPVSGCFSRMTLLSSNMTSSSVTRFWRFLFAVLNAALSVL